MVRRVLIGAVLVMLCPASAHAAAGPRVSEVEAEMEVAYVMDPPDVILQAAVGNPAGFSLEADCWRQRAQEKRWSCDLIYTTSANDDDLACTVDGLAWMTRRGLKTWRSRHEQCDD